ncbi:CBU_0592 family membrane protein [Rickettsiella endosymbiont of Aleochara curtula]|uniref:CBU_0592 family membrane protein n=1 Tax=Rickettsiella endosymbiont of Aleochara curtula TaxID=3077936 RepID=UPI003CC7AEF5
MTSIVLSKHFFFITGLSFVLVAYIFQQTNSMKIKGFLYNFINMLGAGLLVYVSFQPLQIDFFIFAALWTFISIIRVYKSFK